MSQSNDLFQAAQKIIPGGVNSPVRAFKGVGGTPIFFKKGEGAYIIDEDDKRYVDYVGSWGPMILGHAHPRVIQSVEEQLKAGLGFGAPTAIETTMAQKVCDTIPSIEMVRMVSSGTEATMSAIRLARGYTNRDKIVKFEGCYHGHADSLLVKAGSGLAMQGEPTSPGVPADFAKHTLTAIYNDLTSVSALINEYQEDIACIIVEPIAGNMGCIPPAPGFLQGLRDLCDQNSIVLIIDEVMTGFRVAYGGAQERFGVYGDLVTLGKIIGGGLPVGAFGGKQEIMNYLSPVGDVYQAGTLSGNPLAMSAGIATLQLIKEEGFYDQIEEKSAYLEKGLINAIADIPIATSWQRVGGMFTLFFNSESVNNFSEALQSDTDLFARYFNGMLAEGINMGPSQFEAGFMSAAHSLEDLDRTIDASHKVLRSCV